jgi:hypothetical protein
MHPLLPPVRSFKNPGNPPPQAITRAFIAFLTSRSLTHFGTFTTGKPASIKSIRRIAENVVNHVDPARVRFMFWVAEEFYSRGGYHFHVLMSCDDIVAVELGQWYQKRYGRNQIDKAIRPCDQYAVSSYCVKNINKPIADWDIWGHNTGVSNGKG